MLDKPYVLPLETILIIYNMNEMKTVTKKNKKPK